MKRIIILTAIFIQTISAIAQQVGSKVSFIAVDGKMYTGIITEVSGNQYKVKYDGYDFSAWLVSSQFNVTTIQSPATRASDMLEPTTNTITTPLPSTWPVHVNTIQTSGPYNPGCSASPLSEVPEFSSWNVPEDKNLLEGITESCLGSAGDAINSLVDLIGNLEQLTSKTSAFWNQQVNNCNSQHKPIGDEMVKFAKNNDNQEQIKKIAATDAYEKIKTLYENMLKLAEGPELYAVSCIWSGVKDYAKETSGGQIMNDLNNIKKTTENFDKAKKAVQGKIQSFRDRISKGGSITMADRALFTDWEDIKKNIESTTKGLNLLAAYVSNPKKLLSYETQAEMAVSSVQSKITSLMGDCQIKACDEELKNGILAGQEALVGARKNTAQTHKNEDKWRQRINDEVTKNYSQEMRSWEYMESNDIRLDGIRTMYDTWVRWHNDRINAEMEVKKTEHTLTKLGELCSSLEAIAGTVNGRISDYENIYYKGRDAVAACEIKNAESAVNQLRNLENSACGYFFPKLSGITYSEDLLEKIRVAKETGKCKQDKNSCTDADAITFAKLTGSWKSYRMNVTIGGSCDKATGTWKVTEWCEGVDETYNATTARINGTFKGRMEGGVLRVDYESPPSPHNNIGSKGTTSCYLSSNGTLSCGFGCSGELKKQ